MENQKIINLLDKIDTDSKHFATKNGIYLMTKIILTMEQIKILVQIIQILLSTTLEY